MTPLRATALLLPMLLLPVRTMALSMVVAPETSSTVPPARLIVPPPRLPSPEIDRVPPETVVVPL